MEIVLWILCAVGAGAIASYKGRSVAGWVCLSLFVGPFAFIVAALPSKEAQEQRDARKYGTQVGDFRMCPICAEAIRATATKCRYCHSDVSVPAPISTPGRVW